MTTDHEIRSLATAAYHGNIDARNELVDRYFAFTLRHVYRIWGRRHPHWADDIASAGVLGLVEAAGTLKPSSKLDWIRWLTWRIGFHVRQTLYSARCPVEVRWDHLSFATLAAASTDQAAAVRAVLGARLVPVEDQGATDPHETIDARLDVETLLARLPAPDRDLVAERYGLDGGSPPMRQEVAARRDLTAKTLYRRQELARFHLQQLAGVIPDKVPEKCVRAWPLVKYRRTAEGFVPVGAS